MADPFSILAGTVGLIDVCWRLTKYLRDVQAAAATIDEEIASLSREVEALAAVNETIQASYKELQASPSPSEADSKQVVNLWRNIRSNVQDCRLLVEELDILIRTIVAKEPTKGSSKVTQKLHGFRKQLRKQSKESDFARLQSRLGTYHNTLQLLLDLIILTHARQSHAETSDSIEQLHVLSGASFAEIQTKLVALQETLQTKVPKTSRNLEDWPTLASSNEHFSVPQGVQPYYTGRLNDLEDVKHAFTAPASPSQVPTQRRIVIYGVGGSGKTQFCCKYAQMYRQNYWGIFWIDASSNEFAKQTFRDIAKIGRVAEDVRSAKYWLSNLKAQWLLIIDNADDPDLELETYIPEGERGHILITTRTPSNKRYGTVGQKALRFQGLNTDDANTLLLKAASEPVPWNGTTRHLAASITEALGFLPLALMHAGKAIMKRLCTLADYLMYHQAEKQKIRDAGDFQGIRKGDNIYMNVYSTFEVNFRGLQNKGSMEANDAIQLLQMFSFFHRENVRVDFLTKAITNQAVEKKQEQKNAEEAVSLSDGGKASWSSKIAGLIGWVGMFFYKERTPAVLPGFLRDSMALEHFDDFRLNAALNELTQLSLITYNDSSASYSMHPVVHTWARERPEFRTVEQAIWCQATTIVLAQCILLPPLGSTEAEERLRLDLLPHIDHVRARQKEINDKIDANRKHCRTAWLHSQPTASRTQIGQMARFSRVYVESGKLDEALELQLQVKDFLRRFLGESHSSSMLIKTALSGTYWLLGQGDKAAELQEEVLHAYEASVGAKHEKALKAVDKLGESRWQQGRLTESYKLHERAFNGMMAALGPDHVDTLKATNNLGRAHAALWHPRQAKVYLTKAVNGMRRNVELGPDHLDTLVAMDFLAMIYMTNEGSTKSTPLDLAQARQLMVEVCSRREKKLGKHHIFTLWATANLARVKAAMGDREEAETDIRGALIVAERSIGALHIGTLYGKLHLGDILIHRGLYQEAEELLTEVADGHQRSSMAKHGEYPDRCKALELLSECYKLQGRMDEAIERCREAIHGMTVLGGDHHPYMKQLRAQHEELAKLCDNNGTRLPVDEPLKESHFAKRAATFG